MPKEIRKYPRPDVQVIRSDEPDLGGRIESELKKRAGSHIIPQIAKMADASEQEVAEALYSMCVMQLPQVLVDDDAWDRYRLEVRKLGGRLPEFTSETEFYHMRFR